MKLASILAIALSGSLAFAAEEKPAAAAPAEPAKTAEAPAADTKTFLSTDLTLLRPLKGQKVNIEGTIAATGANKTDSIRYLNFTKNFRESVSLVFFGNAVPKEKLADFVGKKVRVNGALEEYKEALQIKIANLDQIKVIEEPAPAPTPAAK
jgi:RecG-like helicase